VPSWVNRILSLKKKLKYPIEKMISMFALNIQMGTIECFVYCMSMLFQLRIKT
jgi:hypothetical protein